MPGRTRIQALREFRREYFHALRNGKVSEDAANQALTRVKAWFLENPHTKNLEGIERQEAWGNVLDVLIEFQIMLKDIPIDMDRLPAKPPLEKINDPTIKSVE